MKQMDNYHMILKPFSKDKLSKAIQILQNLGQCHFINLYQIVTKFRFDVINSYIHSIITLLSIY